MVTKINASQIVYDGGNLDDKLNLITATTPASGVDKTSDQTIGGVKTFSSSPVIPTVGLADVSNNAASTSYVASKIGDAAAPKSHVGAGDSAHAIATTTTAGFMSASDKTKLDGVATNANNYTHPTNDGNQHVPATGTSSNKKALVAGATAGSASWQELDLTHLPSSYVKQKAVAATTANLTATFAAGTLTNSSTLGALVIDGISVAVGNRVLVKDQTTAAQNGIYVVSVVGSASVAWVMTRADDAKTSLTLTGAQISVSSGATNGGLVYDTDFKSTDTINTAAINWLRIVDVGMAATDVAAAPGTAAVGNSIKYAREDHVHPLQTTISGNAATATKLQTARDISATGDVSWSVTGFDGSTNATSAATLANTGISTGTYTKVTVDAKGRATAGTNLAATDIPTLTATKISDFDTQVRTSRLDQMAAPTAAVSLNSQKITNLATPTADQDAATKVYVDSVAQGLDAKQSALVATTANITLSGAQTVDSVSLVTGNRVLVKDQTTAAQNGIYVVAAGAWTRASDTDTWNKLVSAFVFVEQGTVNMDSGWVCTSEQGGTIGTTAVTWAQFSGAGQISAGAGLTKTGNTLNVVGTANRVVVNADSVDIASTYVGQTSITTVGTVTSGTWNATAIPITNGGTGATSASAALTELGAAPSSHTHTDATTTTAGFMSASDKTKLDGVATNATANTGTVTGVTGAGTVNGLTLTGTVTTSGSLTLGGTLNVTANDFSSQTANCVLVAPNGAAGKPTFRALVDTDVPSLNASKITSGTLNTARLPFTPVQQGGGANHGTNKVYIGWANSGGKLLLQVDAVDFSYNWPINIAGISNSSKILEGMVSVKSYGAVGDGVADDTAAINSAIAQVKAIGGGTLYFPQGTYKTTSEILIDAGKITIRGTGKLGVNPGVFVPGVNVPSTIMPVHTGRCAFRFYNSTLNAISSFVATGINVATLETATIPTAAFGWDCTTNGELQRNFTFDKCGVYGFTSAFDLYGVGTNANMGFLKIIDCVINRNKWIARTQSSTKWSSFVFRDNEAGNNGSASGEGGISITADACSIEDNRLENTRDPVYILGTQRGVKVTGNYFKGNTGTACIRLDTARSYSVGPNTYDSLTDASVGHKVLLKTCGMGYCLDPYWSGIVHKTPLPLIGVDNTDTNDRLSKSASSADFDFCRVDGLVNQAFVQEPQYLAISTQQVTIGARDIDPNAGLAMPVQAYTTSGSGLVSLTYAITGASGSWVVMSWLLKQTSGSVTLNPYIVMNINNTSASGSKNYTVNDYSKFWRPNEWSIITCAVKLGAAMTSLKLDLYPSGASPAAGLNSRFLRPVVYTVDDINKVVPYVDPWVARSVSSEPTAGTWKQGDTLQLSAPTDGTFGAIVCVSAGTPGTWGYT